MSPYLILIPALYLAALVDTSLSSAVELGAAAPDALMVVGLVWSLALAGERSPLAAGTAGFVSDLVSPGRLGVGLACFAVAGYVLPRLRARFGMRHPLALSLCAWPVATSMVLGPAIVRRWLGEVDLNWSTLLGRGLAVGAFTAAAVMPILLAFAAVRRIKRQRQRV
ncbi:MAG TPA: rod shape-determining protein MreD [Pirellulales bacterium]|jgi:rod shape-determining protein MreD|nr:rod shape-determining protein MreD [Pirellulales bacterium]